MKVLMIDLVSKYVLIVVILLLLKYIPKNVLLFVCGDLKTQEVNEEFKPMMTYGLQGYTAGLVAIKDDVFLNILLVHDPSEDIVKQRIQAYLGEYNDTEYESFVIIRTPEEYTKK